MTAARQGLGEIQRQRPGVDLHRPHPYPHLAHRMAIITLESFRRLSRKSRDREIKNSSK